jgi:uncharacterized protein YjbI with pentapeptide repeats
MIPTPIEPRLAPELEAWEGDTDGKVELDQHFVKDEDFTGATRLSVDASRIQGANFTGVVLDKLEATDASCSKVEGAGLQAYKVNLLRVSMADCRLAGAEFAEGYFKDCTFRSVKFDEAGFRFANFKRVRFENCMLRQADFSNTKLEDVIFVDCELEECNFVSASCKNVDVSTEELTGIRGLLGLKGATISYEQLMQLAPLLASELGFHVKDAP